MNINRLDHKALIDVLQWRTALRLDVLRLYGLARYSQAKVMIELGVGIGASTVAMMLALDENDGQLLISLDHKDFGGVLRGNPKWVFLQRDTTLEDTLLEVKTILYDNLGPVPRVSFIFVDSSHLYADTMAELRLWPSIVAVGGIIAFHDTKSVYGQGVSVPIQEFLEHEPTGRWEYKECLPSKHGFGYLMRKGK